MDRVRGEVKLIVRGLFFLYGVLALVVCIDLARAYASHDFTAATGVECSYIGAFAVWGLIFGVYVNRRGAAPTEQDTSLEGSYEFGKGSPHPDDKEVKLTPREAYALTMVIPLVLMVALPLSPALLTFAVLLSFVAHITRHQTDYAWARTPVRVMFAVYVCLLLACVVFGLFADYNGRGLAIAVGMTALLGIAITLHTLIEQAKRLSKMTEPATSVFWHNIRVPFIHYAWRLRMSFPLFLSLLPLLPALVAIDLALLL